MKYQILHEAPSTLRFRVLQRRMTMEQADLLDESIRRLPGVERVTVHERTCGVIIRYTGDREALILALARFSYEKASRDVQLLSHSSRALNREYKEKIVLLILRRCLKKLYLPASIRHTINIVKAIPYGWRALGCLVRGKLGVDLLDGAAITASLLTGDFETAGSVMFLLKLGDYLDQWTHKKSIDDLARSMALNIDRVWLRTNDGDAEVPLAQVQAGDEIIVHAGSMIPLDGTLTEGEAMVNQASLTGESVPVAKREGSTVFAGTVVEEGRCVIAVKGQGSKYDQIVKMIEESEKLNSGVERKAASLADRLVPWVLGGSGLTYLLTRNVTRAVSVLMVDFSCALKLAMPLSVLSAMREASGYRITVKGGKYLEKVAQATTILFDKTGTLTRACPTVAEVIPFHGQDADEMLRVAACLEKHFPHSMANAVVEAARQKGLDHREMHTKVEYIVAHGIASRINRKTALIGSYHFIFEDEKVRIDPEDREKFDRLPDHCSLLYLAIGKVLSAVICISDPLRPEARETVAALKEAGFAKTVMLTGDSARTAAAIAAEVGVDEFRAEVLPEDKAQFIREEQARGRTVVMIGDGINDAPALSLADVGVAIGTGAAIAREVADVTIQAEDLRELVYLKTLSDALIHRIQRNCRFILGFNGGLIGLGALGILPPATSALLHNGSTVLLSANSMTPVLRKQDYYSDN